MIQTPSSPRRRPCGRQTEEAEETILAQLKVMSESDRDALVRDYAQKAIPISARRNNERHRLFNYFDFVRRIYKR